MPETLPPALIAALASIVTAGVAATVSLIVSILAKEQKTSEFRQQWINDLRDDLASLLSEASILYGYVEVARKADNSHESFLSKAEERYDNVVRAEMLVQRLKMRLNPREHDVLLGLLDQLVEAPDRASECAKQIVEAAQVILKTEWRRVKKGELAYRFAKQTAGLLVVVAIASIGCLVYWVVAQAR